MSRDIRLPVFMYIPVLGRASFDFYSLHKFTDYTNFYKYELCEMFRKKRNTVLLSLKFSTWSKIRSLTMGPIHPYEHSGQCRLFIIRKAEVRALRGFRFGRNVV
jgi:hypothetical protein